MQLYVKDIHIRTAPYKYFSRGSQIMTADICLYFVMIRLYPAGNRYKALPIWVQLGLLIITLACLPVYFVFLERSIVLGAQSQKICSGTAQAVLQCKELSSSLEFLPFRSQQKHLAQIESFYIHYIHMWLASSGEEGVRTSRCFSILVLIGKL